MLPEESSKPGMALWLRPYRAGMDPVLQVRPPFEIVLCDEGFSQFFTNRSPKWPSGGKEILDEIAQALDPAVEEFGDEVHRDYRGQWPGFGGAHDFINPQFYLILLNLSSAVAITAASRALIGYMRERRSDISLKVGDVEINIKRSKDVAADVARIVEILGPELVGRDIRAERIKIARVVVESALRRGTDRSKIIADLEKAEAKDRIDRVSLTALREVIGTIETGKD